MQLYLSYTLPKGMKMGASREFTSESSLSNSTDSLGSLKLCLNANVSPPLFLNSLCSGKLYTADGEEQEVRFYARSCRVSLPDLGLSLWFLLNEKLY